MAKISRCVRAVAFLLAAPGVAVGCSGKNDSGGTVTAPAATPTITVSASTSSLLIVQGGTSIFQVAVTRTGGFAGDIVVSVEGLPAGVTTSALTIASTAISGFLTLTAAGNAPVASANLTIRGTASGVSSATASFVLTVLSGDGDSAITARTAATARTESLEPRTSITTSQ